ncbi:MAG: 5-formyltetrahydrofolate cyclo-ligase [Pseudomonadota bacterium]
MSDKNQLRRTLREKRRHLTVEQQGVAAKGLINQLATVEQFVSGERVALYLTNDGEISPEEACNWLWAHERQVFLPIVIQGDGNRLLFAPYELTTTFEYNRFGIPEPQVDAGQLIEASLLDLVLLPLVGFDDAGNRIGMGGGFYDRTFEFVREQGLSKPAMIGLSHEVQKVRSIDSERWDIPLSMVVTDQKVYRF